ncbi:peptide-binding protein [bacterium]|nr:peptide-binding protein [bacterium]
MALLGGDDANRGNGALYELYLSFTMDVPIKKRRWSPIVIGLVAMVVSGCMSRSSQHTQHVLRLRLAGEPSVLNPLLITDTGSSAVASQVFSGLVRFNEQFQLVPDLATHWVISDGGKRLTFYLRRDVKWHDGHPFTSRDVIFTFQTLLNPRTNTVRRSDYMVKGQPIQFAAPDPYTVVVTLPQPFAPLLYRMGMEIIPAHRLEGKDINTDPFNRHPIGTGPFQFDSWQPNQFVKLKAYAHYHGGKPRLKTVLFRIIPEYNVAKSALIKGDIDLLEGVSPLDVPALSRRPTLRVVTYDEWLYSYMGFNLKNPHLSNPLVRRAMVHAVDRDLLIKAVLFGYGRVAHVPISPLSWAYPKPITPLSYDPKKAISLLEQAGYVRRKDGWFYHQNRRLALTVLVSKGGKAGPKNAEIIQRYFKMVGIQLTIQQLEWQAFLKVVTGPSDPKPFDLCLLSWSLSPDPDAYSIWHSSQYPKGFNFVGYHNPQVDQLIEAGRLVNDQASRQRIYHQAFRLIAQDTPYLFLYYPRTITAVNRRLTGLSHPGPAGLLVTIETVGAP